MMTSKNIRTPYALCIQSDPDNFELLVGKVYRVMKPQKGDRDYDLRVIDDSAEDYLYPAKWFVPIEVPAKARKAIKSALGAHLLLK